MCHICDRLKERTGYAGQKYAVFFTRDGEEQRMGWQNQVRLTHMRVCMYLGTYDTIEEAVKIRDEAALKLHGEFATTGE